MRRATRARTVLSTVGALIASMAVGAGEASATETLPAIDVERASISDLQTLLTTGAATSEGITKVYVKRILQTNTNGPGLRAVQELSSTWLEQAQASDKRRSEGKTLGPLDGIPILLKANIDIKGDVTSSGSVPLAKLVAPEDATLTANLRRAGAVLLGHATMTEFAYWDGTAWGYSSLGGQPLNPFDSASNTGASSAGSGVAAGAGLAPIAMGTDTGGSVINPSLSNSLVGIRPSTGLISRTGIMPITEFADTAGVMGRSVKDVAAFLNVLPSIDPTDPATADAVPYQGRDYLAALSTESLQGKRIGIFGTATTPLFDDVKATLTAQGATLVPVTATLPGFPFDVTNYEFREGLDKFLKNRTPPGFPIKDVPTLAQWYRDNPRDGTKFGAANIYTAEAIDLVGGRAQHDASLATARTTARARIDGLMNDNNLDAIVFSGGGATSVSPIGGYPQVAVPAGYNAATRRPFGVTFLGKRFDEANLLSYAYDYEQASKLRKTPSEINPSLWRCVGDTRATTDPSLCLPGAETKVSFEDPVTDPGPTTTIVTVPGPSITTTITVPGPVAKSSRLTLARVGQVSSTGKVKIRVSCAGDVSCGSLIETLVAGRTVVSRTATIKRGTARTFTLAIPRAWLSTARRNGTVKVQVGPVGATTGKTLVSNAKVRG